MKKSRIFVAVFVLTGVIVTAMSFLELSKASEGTAAPGRINKADLVYGRAEVFLRSAEHDKAANAFLMIVEEYPGSGYVEKALRELASIYFGRGDYVKARDHYRRLLKDFPGVKDAREIRDTIGELGMSMMRSSATDEGSIEHEVLPGDTLIAIAKKYNTTVGLIKRMNDLKSDMIRVGQKLKVTASTFSIHVDKSRNMLVLKKDGETFKTYTIATGKDNSTPTGVFTIVSKMVRPTWTKPGVGIVTPDSEEYELGERWMALSVNGYGIHGTNDESSLGRQSTAGCVRMSNEDVIELYDMVPNGTEVEIVD